jgi:hypothetical protein
VSSFLEPEWKWKLDALTPQMARRIVSRISLRHRGSIMDVKMRRLLCRFNVVARLPLRSSCGLQPWCVTIRFGHVLVAFMAMRITPRQALKDDRP